MPTEVFVGLGSNIDPERHLAEALEAVRDGLTLVATSPVYRCAAVGFTGDDFLNMVIRLQCTLDPAALGDVLAEIERSGGRQRAVSSTGREANVAAAGPRTLDMDLLLYGSVVDPQLGLPRSDVLRYAFVLRPLAELAPGLVHPVTGRTMLAEWEAVAEQSPPMHAQHLLMSG